MDFNFSLRLEGIELYDHGQDIPYLTAIDLDNNRHISPIYSFSPPLPEDLDSNYDSNSHMLIPIISIRSIVGHSPSEVRDHEITPLLEGKSRMEKLHNTAVDYLGREIKTRRHASAREIADLIDKTYLAKPEGRPMEYLNHFNQLRERLKQVPGNPNSV